MDQKFFDFPTGVYILYLSGDQGHGINSKNFLSFGKNTGKFFGKISEKNFGKNFGKKI